MHSQIFNGRWKRVPPYSPRLAPIERGFSLIWNHVRRREWETERDPEQAIRNAFLEYSIIGPSGHKAKRHFSMYAKFHKAYVMGVPI